MVKRKTEESIKNIPKSEKITKTNQKTEYSTRNIKKTDKITRKIKHSQIILRSVREKQKEYMKKYREEHKDKFPKIKSGKIEQLNPKFICTALYSRDDNFIAVDITPKAFKSEYDLYGFSGLIRDLSVTIIHELTHWASNKMSGHRKKVVMSNSYRSLKYAYRTGLWNLIIHSVIYDLQRKEPYKTYLEV